MKNLYRPHVITPVSDGHVFIDKGEAIDVDGTIGVKRNGIIWTDATEWYETEAEAWRWAAIQMEKYQVAVEAKISWCLEQARDAEVRHAHQAVS